MTRAWYSQKADAQNPPAPVLQNAPAPVVEPMPFTSKPAHAWTVLDQDRYRAELQAEWNAKAAQRQAERAKEPAPPPPRKDVALLAHAIRKARDTLSKATRARGPLAAKADQLRQEQRRLESLLPTFEGTTTAGRLQAELGDVQRSLALALEAVRGVQSEIDGASRLIDARVAEIDAQPLTAQEELVRTILGVATLRWDQRVAGATADHQLVLVSGQRVDPAQKPRPIEQAPTEAQETPAGEEAQQHV